MPHFHIKMHFHCFKLREQNQVYLSVKGDLWPDIFLQIRLHLPNTSVKVISKKLSISWTSLAELFSWMPITGRIWWPAAST